MESDRRRSPILYFKDVQAGLKSEVGKRRGARELRRGVFVGTLTAVASEGIISGLITILTGENFGAVLKQSLLQSVGIGLLVMSFGVGEAVERVSAQGAYLRGDVRFLRRHTQFYAILRTK